MKMLKLPDDKQARMKVIAVIVLGAALALLGLVQGVVMPLVRSSASKRTTIAEMQGRVRAAEKEIALAITGLRRSREDLKLIQGISDQYLLHPALGNYLLNATEIIERAAAKGELTLPAVREIGMSDIPVAARSKRTNEVKAYTARVSLTCSLDELIALLSELESANPYLCTSSITITGQPTVDPAKHIVTFDVQWPIWADPEKPAQIRQNLEQETTLEVAAAHAK